MGERLRKRKNIDIQLEYRAKTPSAGAGSSRQQQAKQSTAITIGKGALYIHMHAEWANVEHGSAHIAFILVDLIPCTSHIVFTTKTPCMRTVYAVSSLLLYFRFSFLLPRCWKTLRECVAHGGDGHDDVEHTHTGRTTRLGESSRIGKAKHD